MERPPATPNAYAFNLKLIAMTRLPSARFWACDVSVSFPQTIAGCATAVGENACHVPGVWVVNFGGDVAAVHKRHLKQIRLRFASLIECREPTRILEVKDSLIH